MVLALPPYFTSYTGSISGSKNKAPEISEALNFLPYAHAFVGGDIHFSTRLNIESLIESLYII